MFLFRTKFRRKFDQPTKFDEPLVLDRREEPSNASPAPVSMPAPTDISNTDDPVMRPRRRRTNGNKTRLMGFDTADGRVVDLFDEDKAIVETGRSQFPVAMVMVTKGPGFGECFAIKSGMSQIGRSEGQAIQLEFGDMAISRENHAAVVYDPKNHTFLLGHGGKSNIVRLNGKPVVSTSDLTSGDEIEIGETQLRFVALCSDAFNWDITETEEGTDDDDVEIA
ncbi:FHA domain-containing protein [Rhodobacteraceae bacterium]|nr:FHA domain-containing protein [Paracoccaceae bacterium]